MERIENLRWYFSLKGCKLRSAWARGQLKQLIPAFDIIFCMADSSKWSHFVKIVKFSMEREGRWCFRNKLLSFYFVVRCRCSAGLISVFSGRSRISRIHKKHFTLSLKSDSHKRWKAATTTTYCQLVKDIFCNFTLLLSFNIRLHIEGQSFWEELWCLWFWAEIHQLVPSYFPRWNNSGEGRTFRWTEMKILGDLLLPEIPLQKLGKQR